jgi:hypothetical protein
MLRRKTAPELTRTRLDIAARLVALRCELFGERRSSKRMAEWLGVPARTWLSYERGTAIPGIVILSLIVETSVEPEWLLHGTGPMFRLEDAPLTGTSCCPATAVRSLLQLAINRLGREQMFEPIPA